MKLIGNVKKQVENEDPRDGRNKLIEKAGMKLTDEELEKVAGGLQEDGIIINDSRDYDKDQFIIGIGEP